MIIVDYKRTCPKCGAFGNETTCGECGNMPETWVPALEEKQLYYCSSVEEVGKRVVSGKELMLYASDTCSYCESKKMEDYAYCLDENGIEYKRIPEYENFVIIKITGEYTDGDEDFIHTAAIGVYDNSFDDSSIFYWFDDFEEVIGRQIDFIVRDYEIIQSDTEFLQENADLLFSNNDCEYCKDEKSNHFLCDSCGVGMCDSCYGAGFEHNHHYHLPLENCESKLQKTLVKRICKNDDPQYICEKCLNEAFTTEKIAFIKEDLENLVGTRWTKENLEKQLQEKYEILYPLENIEKGGLVADNAFIMGIFKDFGYIDIYYLKDRNNDCYITEVNVSEE